MRGDPDRLEWVIIQLIDNGIKFSPTGSRVTIGTSLEDGFVTLFVKDNGVGIPPERIQEICKKYICRIQ